MTKAIFLPGNGGDGTPDDNWFPYLTSELTKLGIKVIAETFPDPILARREYWIPFLEQLGADENTILVGHSSGAVAAMRYAEQHKILGSILVGVCYTDMGIESEKVSGYYDDPWNWEEIQKNQKWIALFSSSDDPFIPIAEPRHARDMLKPTYFEFSDRGHFMIDHNSVNAEFPEVVTFIKSEIK